MPHLVCETQHEDQKPGQNLLLDCCEIFLHKLHKVQNLQIAVGFAQIAVLVAG